MRSLLADLEIVIENNPDFTVFRHENFGIDEARELSRLALRNAISSNKIFLIIAESITLEAQNALLKTFEDPISDTFFFLAVKDKSLIIPTLRSRMQITNVKHPMFNINTNTEAEKFLKLAPKDRLLFTKKFVDSEKNLSDFLDDLLVLLKNKSGVEDVYKLRLFADDRAVSARLILEHLSLVI